MAFVLVSATIVGRTQADPRGRARTAISLPAGSEDGWSGVAQVGEVRIAGHQHVDTIHRLGEGNRVVALGISSDRARRELGVRVDFADREDTGDEEFDVGRA